MIYQDALRFLKHHIKNVSTDFQWSETDNEDFFEMMLRNYLLNDIKESISNIQEAFSKIFENVGEISFNYNGDKIIQLKVTPFSTDPKQSQYLPTLIKIIQTHDEDIEHAYTDTVEQRIIKGAICHKVYSELSKATESVNKKQLIKEAIRTALQLNPQDIILVFKHKFVVKIYVEDKSQKPMQIFTETDLAVDYKDFFEEVDHDSFFDIIIDSVTENALDFDYMDNGYYEQYSLKEIRDSIVQELIRFLDDQSIFIKAFAGYILKRDLLPIHERIAKVLLYEVVNKSVPAKNFLEYYSGETVLVEGKKYKTPSLETPDGGKLNMLTVNSVATACLTAQDNKENLFLAWYDITKLLNSELHSLNTLKEDFEAKKRGPREELLKIQKQLRDQEEEVNDVNHKRQNIKHEIHKLNQKIAANQKSFDTILASLAKALMKRKKAL